MHTDGLVHVKWTTFCYYLALLTIFATCTGTTGVGKEVTSPNEDLCINHFCGYPNDLPVHAGVFENGTDFEIYQLNRTLAQLKSQGFDVVVDKVFGDAIRSINYTDNEGNSKRVEFVQFYGLAPVGGKPALIQRMYFMALLGQRKRGGADWICDGILINDQWVLSAAHCFYSSFNIDVIRLGEFDWKKQPQKLHDNYPFDHAIEKIVPHPLYKPTVGYHDLILIKLKTKIGTMHANIAPICLPWGTETNRNHIGSTLTLSGWGATSYHYAVKFPEGITEKNILCAGSDEGGKDACKGDSGAPLVYERTDGKMVLAAVVSAGFGCGLKEFPGLYIPINSPFYLQWIKDVAFSQCQQSGF